MDFRYNLPMKVISTIVLAFFLWTFGGLFDIAYAVKNSDELGVRSWESKKPKTEKKFEKTIEDIEQVLTDPATDAETKKNKIKVKKAEIEAYDIEIRQQFEETERKIKETGLPLEILQRHDDFVSKYEENLRELKANLEAIEKAKGKVEVEAEVEKAKEFIKKVKPPKKHIPLDPNKLPHRTPEVKKPELIERQPDKKKFKLPRLLKQNAGLKTGYKIQDARFRIEDTTPLSPPLLRGELKGGHHRASGIVDRESILIASNGPLTGLLTPDPFDKLRAGSEFLNPPLPFAGEGWGEGVTPNSELSAQNLLLAQADPPTDADLAETIEVQFTPEIIAKAQELENKPVKIYNWVRNNIEFVPTYGSIQGADYCLQTKLCNAFDTASLLIALLRASGIHARYVEGTVEIPIEKVKNWVGGFTDSMAAINLLASAGIPTTGMLVGGEVKYARIEHIWAEAYVPYGPYSGRPSKLNPTKTWVPLDPSFKQYNYTQGIDIQSAVPFDAQSFVDQITATATINEEEGYVTGVDSLYINQTMTDYQTQVENYITQNYPDATVGDVLGKKEIIKQELGILPATLPYKRIVTGARYSEIPDYLRHRISFRVVKDIYDELLGTPMNISKSLPEIAGKKITLSYSPATPEDEAVINSYLPEPHEDGTPIDPSELPTSLPAYLINVKPELRVDGEVIATGSAVGLGVTEEFKMTFSGPGLNANDVITNNIQAGEYLGIALDLGRISQEQMEALKTKLEATKAKLEAEDFTGITKDDILGDLLYITALSFYVKLDAMDYVQAKTMGVVAIRLPSEAHFSSELSVYSIWGIPMTVSAAGLAMDVDRQYSMVKALDGNTEKPKQFFRSSGANGSALEYSVPEQLFSAPENPAVGISAVKAIQIANDQGIPIYTINQENIDTILPQLQVDSGTITDIKNAVNAGMEAIVSKTEITYNGWTGCGYVITDPNTGAGGYMISGGLSGAVIAMFFGAFLMFSALALTASAVLAPMGVLLFIGGFIAFVDGATTYFGDLTQQEEDFFVCILPAYVQTLVTIIFMGVFGHLVRPLFQFGIDYFGGIGTVSSIVDCIENTF